MSLKDFKPMDAEEIKAELFKMFQEQSQKSSLLQELQTYPTFAKLESAFKNPELDEAYYAKQTLPVIWNSYATLEDGFTIDTNSIVMGSNLYSQYVDEPAILVDEGERRLFLFVPNEKTPAVAFKGGRWSEALKLKSEAAITMSLTEALKNLNNKQ